MKKPIVFGFTERVGIFSDGMIGFDEFVNTAVKTIYGLDSSILSEILPNIENFFKFLKEYVEDNQSAQSKRILRGN